MVYKSVDHGILLSICKKRFSHFGVRTGNLG